jgi:hypothetical protein
MWRCIFCYMLTNRHGITYEKIWSSFSINNDFQERSVVLDKINKIILI